MEEKLKSLKDLKVYGSGFTFSGKKSKRFPYMMYRHIDLKESAIKDIKAIESKKSKWSRKDIINYIKWKFDITDDALCEVKEK